MRVLSALTCLLVAASLTWAAIDEAKLRDSMKQIGPTCGGLGKKIAAKDASATADAHKLHQLFEESHGMWAGKADATTWSKAAGAEFKTIAGLTADGKWDEAGASFKKATSNCGGCHNAYREKTADGTYKLKQ